MHDYVVGGVEWPAVEGLQEVVRAVGRLGLHEGEAARGGEGALCAEKDPVLVVDAAVSHGDRICFDGFGEALPLSYSDF